MGKNIDKRATLFFDPVATAIEAIKRYEPWPDGLEFFVSYAPIKKKWLFGRRPLGQCFLCKDGVVEILVDVRAPVLVLAEVICHEAAHAITREDHTVEWERVFGELDRLYHEVMDGDSEDVVII